MPPARTAAGRASAPGPGRPAAAASASGSGVAQRYVGDRSRGTTPRHVVDDHGDDGGRGSRGRVLAIIGGALAVAVVAVVLVTQVFGGEDSSTGPAPNTVGERPASQRGAGSRAPAVDRSKVVVTVINGTTVQGLARGALNLLVDKRFQDGGVATDTTNQSRTETVVFYADGERAAAQDVARVLKFPRSRVTSFAAEPDGPGIRLLARQDADVVVVLGSDKAQQPATG
jgi:LytR cell envelope-related transcriptional attenuator